MPHCVTASCTCVACRSSVKSDSFSSGERLWAKAMSSSRAPQSFRKATNAASKTARFKMCPRKDAGAPGTRLMRLVSTASRCGKCDGERRVDDGIVFFPPDTLCAARRTRFTTWALSSACNLDAEGRCAALSAAR